VTTEEETNSQQERILEKAVVDSIQLDHEDGVVVGWVLLAAVQLPHDEEGTMHYMYFVPGGQMLHTTVGMLELGKQEIMSDD
jgi:hypothetical protein